MRDIVVGQVTGTGAALNVSIGFVPSAVILFLSGTEGFSIHTLDLEQGATSGHLSYTTLTGKALDGVSQAEGATVDASSHVTGYVGDSTHAEGFSVSASAIVNVNGEAINYIAFRGDRNWPDAV